MTYALVLTGVHIGCVSNWLPAAPSKKQLSQCSVLRMSSQNFRVAVGVDEKSLVLGSVTRV